MIPYFDSLIVSEFYNYIIAFYLLPTALCFLASACSQHPAPKKKKPQHKAEASSVSSALNHHNRAQILARTFQLRIGTYHESPALHLCARHVIRQRDACRNVGARRNIQEKLIKTADRFIHHHLQLICGQSVAI